MRATMTTKKERGTKGVMLNEEINDYDRYKIKGNT